MKIIGHRGAKGLAPENTLASFKKALACGVAAVELDVHCTKDGIPVCSHDPTMVAKGGKWYAIPRFTYAELHKVQPDLATLEDVIRLVDRKVPIIIEIKENVPVEPVIACVQNFLKQGWHTQDFAFCSFVQKPLLALHAAFPTARLIPNEKWSSVKACLRARQLDTQHIALNQRWLWRGYLRMMQQRGWQISSFTVNNPSQAHKWEPYLYAIYTDYPDRFTTQ